MIAESPTTLLVLLAVLTMLGAVVGYCVATIIAKRRLGKTLEAIRIDHDQERHANQSDLQAAKRDLSELRSSLPGDGQLDTDREKNLHSQTLVQAQRIQNLEAEITSLQHKHSHLSRDFASYKAIKTRELELARNTTGQLVGSTNPPILSRKVDHASVALRTGQSPSKADSMTLGTPSGKREAFGQVPLREIDIPALAESELLDSDDPQDLNVSGAPGSGARGRG